MYSSFMDLKKSVSHQMSAFCINWAVNEELFKFIRNRLVVIQIYEPRMLQDNTETIIKCFTMPKLLINELYPKPKFQVGVS